MKLVRLIKNWQWPDLMQQTPGHTGIWEEIQFTEEPVPECDYLVILNNLEADLELRCPPENVWRIVQEPPVEFFKAWHVNPSYSAKTFTCDPELSGPEYIRSHPMLPWHVNRDYDFLSTCPLPEKSEILSWITSTRNVLPGHKKRMNFLYSIKEKVAELYLLGGNIRHIMNQEAKERIEREQRELGFKTIEDKWAGLAPYKYSMAIESHKGPDYWSEKIADCFLAWAVPIYYGCTNLEDYFPKDSFIRIDIEKPDEAIDTIKKILKEDTWEKRLPALKEARELVLNKYQFFPFLSNHIDFLTHQSISRKKMFLKSQEIGKPVKKKKKPKISVVVCTYNRAEKLPGCLESLANQRSNKELYEVLVIDNNSKDNTQEVVKKFEKKYSNFKLFFEQTQGLSHARNLGLKEASADHVGFIDDESRVGEGWIEEALKIIHEKKPDIFGGPTYPVFPDGKPEWFKHEYGIRGDMGETGWIEKGLILGGNMFCRKSLLKEYGGFDPRLGMKGDEIGYHEETKLVFRALREKKKVYYSKELAVKDIIPGYKKNLVFFIYQKYKAGFDGQELWNEKFESTELPKLLALINQAMDEMNFALLKRDTLQYKYPENYIIERTGGKFFRIGRQVGYFLKRNNLTEEKFLDFYLNRCQLREITGKIAKKHGTFKTIFHLISYHLRHIKLLDKLKKGKKK